MSNLKLVSDQQMAYLMRLFSGDYPKEGIIYVRGGGNSGKSFATGLSVAHDAAKFDGIVQFIVHKNLSTVRRIYRPPIELYLNALGYEEKKDYQFDKQLSKYILFNKSEIQFVALNSPDPYEHGNKIHGAGGNRFVIDEGSNVEYAWMQYMLESSRLRNNANQKYDYNNHILVTDNTDPLGWCKSLLIDRLDPITLEPADYINVEDWRIDTWNNVLISEKQLEIMKNGGHAARFYYSDPTLTQDHSQVFPYTIVDTELRLNYVYAMDFGFKAYTTLLQVGFGGDLSVTANELYYAQGCSDEIILGICKRLVDYHENAIKALQTAIPRPLWGNLKHWNKATLVIDSARPDIGELIRRKFGLRIDVVLSNKNEKKVTSTERAKRLLLKVFKTSKFFIRELNQYRYKSVTHPNEERLPDGSDDLIDSYRYAAIHILKLFEVNHTLCYWKASNVDFVDKYFKKFTYYDIFKNF